jgi:hypothetical protein
MRIWTTGSWRSGFGPCSHLHRPTTALPPPTTRRTTPDTSRGRERRRAAPPSRGNSATRQPSRTACTAWATRSLQEDSHEARRCGTERASNWPAKSQDARVTEGCFARLAGLAAHACRHEQAADLFGAAEESREIVGCTGSRYEEERRAVDAAAVRDALGTLADAEARLSGRCHPTRLRPRRSHSRTSWLMSRPALAFKTAEGTSGLPIDCPLPEPKAAAYAALGSWWLSVQSSGSGVPGRKAAYERCA